MSKDIPILFSAPMIRALIEGHKTQTRRILKPQLVCTSHAAWPDEPEPVPSLDEDGVHCAVCGAGIEMDHRRKSGVRGIPVRYAVGDRLWVRENFMPRPGLGRIARPHYRADPRSDRPEWRGLWKPSIHMSRWVSRLTLPVEAIKVERVQKISNEDAIAEGVLSWREGWTKKQAAEMFLRGTEAAVETKEGTVAQRLFYLLWTTINGIDAWQKNPFVVASTFRVIKANIDSPEARAAA